MPPPTRPVPGTSKSKHFRENHLGTAQPHHYKGQRKVHISGGQLPDPVVPPGCSTWLGEWLLQPRLNEHPFLSSTGQSRYYLLLPRAPAGHLITQFLPGSETKPLVLLLLPKVYSLSTNPSSVTPGLLPCLDHGPKKQGLYCFSNTVISPAFSRSSLVSCLG